MDYGASWVMLAVSAETGQERTSVLKPGQHMEPGGNEDFLKQLRSREEISGAGRNAPGPAVSATGQRMDSACSSFPSAHFSVVSYYSFPCGGHQALLRTGYCRSSLFHRQHLTPGGQKSSGNTGLTGRGTLACECFKNKQPELASFLNFRDAHEQVSLHKVKPISSMAF